MITAKEASERMNENIDMVKGRMLGEIEEAILDEIDSDNPFKFVIVDGGNYSVVKKDLESLGYIVTTSSERNEFSMRISWED